MKVLLRTPVNPFTGYGNDGIGLAEALVRAGADVRLAPTHFSPPVSQEVADLLTKPQEAPFDLYINHAPPGQLLLNPESAEHMGFAVGWTMWEAMSFDDMPKKERKPMRKNFTTFDMIAGYDPVSTQALSTLAPVEKLETIQGGFDPGSWTPVERDWTGDRFSFIMHGQLHDRKDPFTAIMAFRELKIEKGEAFDGAELHMHTTIPGLHPAMEQWTHKLRIHYASWPRETLQAFYGSGHVLLAPSRGEGKNLPALEFMATGGAVIATNFGGHTMWLNRDYSYPLNYEPRSYDARYPRCIQAAASKDHLKELMWHVYSHRDEVRRKAQIASEVIPQMCSWDHQLAEFMRKISTKGDKGRKVWDRWCALMPQKGAA